MDDDHKAVYEALLAAHASGAPCVLVTVISTQGSMPRHAGSKMLVNADGTTIGTIGGGAMESRVVGDALAALAAGEPRTVTYTLNSLDDGDPGICGGSAQLFIEPVQPPLTLLVIGGGHCGKALAELAHWSGYRVILSDDRPDYCNPSVVPGLAGYVVCPPAQIVDHLTIDHNTYIAAVTRGLAVDLHLIPALLRTPAPYIGLIGSRRRWLLTARALRSAGVSDDQIDRVRSPIGLELNAETPKEIAVSILAEIIAVRRGAPCDPRPMKAGFIAPGMADS